MVIGNNTVIYSPNNCVIDQTRPWMIEIGDNVSITTGVTILTHGYDWSVFKGIYGDVLGSAGRVKIGNNVFIGMNSTILKGVTIGNNVVIGANSLINKNVPDNSVVVGNPQRVVVILILTLKNGVRHRSLRRRTFMVVGKGTHQMANGGGTSEGDILRILLAFRATDRGQFERLFVRVRNGIAWYARA